MSQPSVRLIEGVRPSDETVSFMFEGEKLTGWKGEAIASAVMRAGLRTLRRTRIGDEPRGYYCGMGLCWECAVHVEGQGVVRSCSEPVREGLVISFADGRWDK
ncbi:(2Fe-2S)-binding protein [Pseudaminobacter sp. 19-2017]|uniref:(2Fe-2S)-binding protein n=1 Tax=Pseudaminobacter soli (ex Zhang et al. 2022) TaxID=2831468 RepID=A0A942DZC6_9HYPH|nr:(2Fe-2S)-binding protein [Pseudaminobacter soli]MBS3650203.1 (2Fe-2S)-binding protein [Pseudaminobacter soli]